MADVRVTMQIDAPIERVFNALSDHESFLTFGPTKTTVVREGEDTRNGLGCRREVMVAGGALRFIEDVTAWDPPRAYEYLITETSIPAKHYGGRIELVENLRGTNVVWTTEFDVPVPVIGWALKKVAKRTFRLAFRDILKRAKKQIEA
jgi:uncharacterized protein YndB with AHSA1/START domain